MSLKLEVEELRLTKVDDYLAVVRMNRYEKRKSGGAKWTVEDKAETLGEFIVPVPRKPHGRQQRERPIEDIEKDARQAVLLLCQEVVRASQPAQKPQK
jgi:hypothetical protein